MESYLDPQDMASEAFEMENLSVLNPEDMAPEQISDIVLVENLEDYSNPAQEGFKLSEAVDFRMTDAYDIKDSYVSLDRKSVTSHLADFGDDYLQSKVQIIRATLSEPRVQEGLKNVGLVIKPEDLSFDRLKLALAIFGGYKLLTLPQLSKYSGIIGLGFAYMFYRHSKVVKDKVAMLSEGVDPETKAQLGHFGGVCNRRSGGFR